MKPELVLNAKKAIYNSYLKGFITKKEYKKELNDINFLCGENKRVDRHQEMKELLKNRNKKSQY